MATPEAEGRLPSLDGLRAVAVWLTIFHHLTGRFALTFDNPLLRAVAYSGDGVGIFFVLSGFLITTLLLREHERSGSIDVTGFYLRRTFRIFPPLYAYLLFVIVFCWVAGIQLRPESILSAGLFFRDYSPGSTFFLTEHTWSLAVEEQFYLLWPPVFILAMRQGGKMCAAKVGIALIVLTPILRVLGRVMHVAAFQHRDVTMMHTRMDALMAGCVLALVIGTPTFERFYKRYARIWWLAPLYTLLIAGLLGGLKRPIGNTTLGVAYTVVLGLTIDSLCIALFIVWATRNAKSAVGQVLNHPIAVWMGVVSYSAYLWQTAFIHESNPTFLARWPWLLVYIWLAAGLSHVLVEKPALAGRRRLEQWSRARGFAVPAARGERS
jgi:peptidoglycan/LPS O-acetylase OafA/YrhL